MTPAPLHRILDAVSAEPAPPDPLDVDQLVRRGGRRRRTRRVVAGSVALLAVAAVGAGTLDARRMPPGHLTANSAPGTVRDMPLRETPALGSQTGGSGSLPRGSYAPEVRGSENGFTQYSYTHGTAISISPNGGKVDTPALAPIPIPSVQSAQPRSVISTGDIRLKDKDVDGARRQVLSVVKALGGEVADEENVSDKDGGLTSAQLTLRVPSARFGPAMARIGAVGTRVSSVNHSDDVTSKVVDTAARISVQRASVARIRDLLARAESIRDIVLIESQLSEREATLESLERQRAYLANQTALSTISVSIAETATKPKPEVGAGSGDDSRHGFVGGLFSGWHALAGSATALAVVTGAATPWLVVLLLLGWPALLLARRARRRWVASYT